MDKPEDQNSHRNPDRRPSREISNADLFADDIVFSDTEKVLFEEDLKESASQPGKEMMDGRPEQRYRAVRKLNEGGMKAVWEVDDLRTARKIAMALIQEEKIASKEDISAFLYEARLTSNLQHPNIIPIYDIALDESGNPYFTMKALRGESLADIIRKRREGDEAYLQRYSRTQMLSLFLKVCNAIDYAHTRGVIHLDLKPSNVHVGDFGDVQVLDWGLALLATHLGEYNNEDFLSWRDMDDVSMEAGETLSHYFEQAADHRKNRNVVGGTPGYMAPEQAQGSPSDIDFRTDVYMLGSMLYEILTHHCPIEGRTVKEVLQKTVRGDFTPPGKRVPENRIPVALEAIVLKAMATDPAERYPTAAAMIRDLQQYQDGFAVSAENPTFITHVHRLITRHKMAVSLIGLSGLIIAVILFNSFREITQSEKVAVNALAKLQERNAYIASMAEKVAPDYLALMIRSEEELAFDAAEQALDTGLAFDPSMEEGWWRKGRMLLCKQEFEEALNILSGNHGHPVKKDPPLIRLAEKYAPSGVVKDSDLPELVDDFMTFGLAEGVPRLFYHLNQSPFDSVTRFPAIAETLKVLNPRVEELHFNWQPMGADGWLIDLGRNPELSDISPLCGLPIRIFNASRTRNPRLEMLTERGLLELRLSGAQLQQLPEREVFTDLRVLDISNTQIRSLPNVLQFSRLNNLNLGGIKELEVPPHLVWCQHLQTLVISQEYYTHPIIQTLARRGVSIVYTDQ